MTTIGFRCTPSIIFYSIMDNQNDVITVIDVNKIIIPKSMTESNKLKYIRNTILDIINEYKIDIAGIRITESNSQRLNIERLHLEGVILELFASSCLIKHFIGQISNITRLLDVPRESFKKIVSGEQGFDDIPNFNEFNKEEKESLLTALGAFQC